MLIPYKQFECIEISKNVKFMYRREEKQYVEGMEDEDIKKETQNLAYPPAFKLEVALFAKKHSQVVANPNIDGLINSKRTHLQNSQVEAKLRALDYHPAFKLEVALFAKKHSQV
jgi:hypothetical protein